MGEPAKDEYVGPSEAIEGYLKLVYPIGHGMIEDWDAMEKIWDHTFELLDAKVGQVDQTENSVEGAFLTEAARNPKATREKTCQMVFEKYNMNRFYLGTQAVLALYSSGR